MDRRGSGGHGYGAGNPDDRRDASPAQGNVAQGSANTLMTPESFGICSNVPPKNLA